MRLGSSGRARVGRAVVLAAALLVGLPLVAGGPAYQVADRPAAVDSLAAPAASGTGTGSTPSAGEPGSAVAPIADLDLTEPGLEGYTAAVPAPSAVPAQSATVSAPGGATPVRLTADTALCGPGRTQVELLGGDRGVSCVHTVTDPAPTRPAAKGAVRMAPICHGNGVNGPRIQFVYVYAENRPNRIGEYGPLMLNSWIPAMEGAFRSTSKEQGREIGMRVYMPNCKIEIGVVKMDAEDAEPDNPGAMRARIEQAMRDAGYTDPDRKYHAWFDGANKGACGVAPLYPLDYPGPANPNNLGSTPDLPVFGGLAQVAVTFKHGVPVPPDTPPMCFGRGGMGATTEIHELLHLLGAVMFSAPNSNGLGHCRDEVDIMCYSEGGVLTYVRCAVQVEALDCGSDDYFNARPQVGSYLSTHWNTANSKFLGAAPDDPLYGGPAPLP